MNENVYDDLRFMSKRIRRLVRANNAVAAEESLLFRGAYSPFFSRNLSPTFEMYCGYGEICNKFYFYGIISEGKFLEVESLQAPEYSK